MSRPHLLLTIGLLGTSCYTHGKYERQYNDAACARYDDCGWLEDMGWASVDDCLEAHEKLDDEQRDDCEGYRRKDAKACVEAMETATCDDLALGETPEACVLLCE